MSKMTGFFAISAAAAMTMLAGSPTGSGVRVGKDAGGDADEGVCMGKACSCEGSCACLFTMLPEAVRATIDGQTAGRRVELVRAENADVGSGPAVIYQARFKKDGTHWDVRIADDGTLISKEKKA